METNEFLGFIIAVIGVVLLGFFGVKLYYFFADADMKNAQAFVNDLSGKIETLNNGESNTFLLRGIENWALVGWNKDVPIAKEGEVIGTNRKPQKCFDRGCLCLCKESAVNCQTQSYCRAIDRNISIIATFNVPDDGADLSAIDNPWKRANSSCYLMPEISNLITFNISKKQNQIIIEPDTYQIIGMDKYREIRKLLPSCNYQTFLT